MKINTSNSVATIAAESSFIFSPFVYPNEMRIQAISVRSSKKAGTMKARVTRTALFRPFGGEFFFTIITTIVKKMAPAAMAGKNCCQKFSIIFLLFALNEAYQIPSISDIQNAPFKIPIIPRKTRDLSIRMPQPSGM